MSDWESAPSGVGDNTRRFLDFLAKAEGADYNVITGGKRFDDFSRHPGVVGMVTKQGPSTAAGRYQITQSTYNDVAPKLGITDFSPASQDRIAIELIRRGGALKDVESGDYNAAIKKLGGTWASLPSSPYAGHPRRSVEWVNKAMMSMFPAAQAQGNPTSLPPITVSSQGAPMAATAKNDWESAPSKVVAPAENPNEWESAPVAGGSTKPASSPTPSPTPKEAPKSALRRIDDFVRGAADAITFGYADEIAAKLDQLTGLNTANANKPSGTASYEANLAAQRERDKQGGGERLAGQLSTVFLPTVGVVRAADTATRGGRALAGATTGAIQGALYGSGSADGTIEDRLKGAAIGGGIGAGTGGVLGALIPATVRQDANALIKKAGGDERARIEAEVIKDFLPIANNPNLKAAASDAETATIAAALRNQKVNSYVDDVKNAIKRVEPEVLKKYDVQSVLSQTKVIDPETLTKIRGEKNGNILADAIEKAQIARAITAPTPASSSFGAKALRFGIEYAPKAVAAAAGTSSFGPAGLAAALLTPRTSPGWAQRLTGKQTIPEVISRLASDRKQQVADEVLGRLGPSQASQGASQIAALARQAEQAQAAQAAARLQARTAAKAPKVENPNALIAELQGKDPSYIIGLSNQLGAPRNAAQMDEFSKLIRQQMEARVAREAMAREAAQAARAGADAQTRNAVLAETRRPLGGGFQELLQGGRAGTNLQSGQAIEALRLLKRRGGAVGDAADQILKSRSVTNEDAFYGLQNAVRGLQERGVIQGSPMASGALSSGVRNPISYAEAVRTAGEAANLARTAAPNKELAQFATTIARTKAPADKAKLLQERLDKTADPAEISYLTQFVEPLTRFGAK